MAAQIAYFRNAPDLGEVRTLYRELAHRNAQSTTGVFGRWTGLRDTLGSSDATQWYNTPLALDQVEWTLALTRHPLVRGFAAPTGPHPSVSEGDLVAAQLLQGMRILDLGCGREPTFARVARALGAHVTTVDVIGPESLRFDRGHFSAAEQEAERANHLTIDLMAADAADRILAFGVEGFDLVTSANLEASSPALFLKAMWAGLLRMMRKTPPPPLQETIAHRVGTYPTVVLIASGPDSYIKIV